MRVSKKITVGGFDHVNAAAIGGDSPVVIQTMWKDRLFLSEIEAAAKRIEGLFRMGCRLVRFAVPDLACAEVLGSLAAITPMPLVADIHFDHKIALRCLDFPVAKIRLNPGNMGPYGLPATRDKIKAVLEKAGEKNVPIRIGLNAGSLPQDLRAQDLRAQGQTVSAAPALAEAAMRELAILDEFGFDRVLVSMKASSIADTVKANKILAEKTAFPLHIGVTEAGPLVAGVARSSAALSMLLAEGIGDTIRVSLSDSMENEVIAAREICGAAAEIAALQGEEKMTSRLRRGGVTVVSCPRCGRHGFDTHGFTSRWLSRLYALDKNLTIAIMGCEVNGPQEAKHADLGITGSGDKVIIFRQGKIVRTVSVQDADEAFAGELALTE